MLKPLSEPGVPFTQAMTVDHTVTSLFTLPEGGFYTVESLVLDAVTGIPLRPVVDYMYFQQDVINSRITSKQIATIIQIRNKSIESVVVKGRYSHGVAQEQLDHWLQMCTTYKDVPLWMNWIACLDDPVQVHPSVKRMVTDPAFDKRTLSDTEVLMNYIADQFLNGDKLFTSHIEYWQQQLFKMAEDKFNQSSADLSQFINLMKTDLAAKVGDFKFTDGDGVKWAGALKNQFHGITLKDRGAQAIGLYTFLPEGALIPARRTNLFQRVTSVQSLVATLSTDKNTYFANETMAISLDVASVTNRVSAKATVQILDADTEELIKEFVINDFKTSLYNFNVNLAESTQDVFAKKLVVRIPEYMWITPVIVNVTPTADPGKGYIKAELLGVNNIGVATGNGYVSQIRVKFKRVGTLQTPQTLYVHLSGDYRPEDIKPGYPVLQKFDFPVTFNESEEIVADFVQQGEEATSLKVNVEVSKSQDPNDLLSIIAENTWYLTQVPVNPYINWYFAIKEGTEYVRVGSVPEGSEIYVVGTLSVDAVFYSSIPQLTIVSSGVGSAIEGVDFILDRGTVINIAENKVAYKISLPLKPEQETMYKFLNVKSINSNIAELWIVDVVQPAPIVGSWHNSGVTGSPVTDWVSENSTFYLHIKTPGLADGTVLNLSLAEPEFYRPYLTYPNRVTVFGGEVNVEIRLNAPDVANPTQFIKMLVTGPNINYTTLGIRVLDTNKPYYEIRYIANGVVDALTVYPGDELRAQVRCIKDPLAKGQATVMLSGSAVTFGPDMDFVVPVGSTDILSSRVINSTEWTDILVSPTRVKSPMRLDHLTLTTSVIFPTTSGVKMGRDTSFTINLRKP